MQYPVCNFSCPSLVPILDTDITACAAGDIHGGLVCVAAVGALPDVFSVFVYDGFDFPVKSAFLAVIAFCVDFRIEGEIVNTILNGHDSLDVVLQIRHFHVTDGTARGQGLESRFKFQFGEGINILSHIDMIRVRDVGMVGHVLNDAKSLDRKSVV